MGKRQGRWTGKAALLMMLAAIGLLWQGPAAWAGEKAEAERIVDRARLTLDTFRSDDTFKDWRPRYGKVAGFLVYPSILKAGFIFGGAGGTGVLVTKDERSGDWLGPVFYTIGGGSLGLLAGLEVAEVLVLVQNDEAVRRLLSTRARVGADVSLVAGPLGAGLGAGNITADLVTLTRAQGLHAGMSLDGSVVAVKDRFNEAYYGRPARPAEILGGGVHNPHADALRRAASALAGGK